MALFSEERLKHLRVLGLKYDATEDDIKKTYKKLALQYHPDKCQNDPNSTKKFQELSAAYYGLKKIIEKERKKTCCNCGFHHYEDGSDCSDYYDSDDDGCFCSQDDEDLLDFFRRIFMDVFSEFVFRKKFQSKRRKKDTFTVEEDEEESFFEFLSKKFHSEGRNTTDDYVLTEEDLKKFQSYDDWQRARDPNKPHNRCKRRAIQKSKRRYQKEDQRHLSKKQLKTEQLRKEKELKEIRHQLLKNLDEKKEKEQQKIQKAKSKVDEGRSKAQSRAVKSPERQEIEEQLAEARKKEFELQTNLRRLEAKELKKEKKLRKLEKKKAKKQSEVQGSPSFQLKSDEFTYRLFQQDLVDTKYDRKKLSNSVPLGKGFTRPIDKQERDKGLQELMDRVKKKTKPTRDSSGDAPEMFSDQYTEKRGPSKGNSENIDPPGTNEHTGSQKLQEHLEAYRELMKLQPKRHTEQQLREERTRIRQAQMKAQQHELENLRKDSANRMSQDDHFLRWEELLHRQQQRERLRNEEEAMEIKEESMRKSLSAPAAPVSRKYYESISYQEKHVPPAQPKQPPRHLPRTRPSAIPVVEHPIKREIPNPQSAWSQMVNSETPWGQRSRKQLEIKTMLPQDEDEEEEMLQQALALSMQTAEEEIRKRDLIHEHLQQVEVDRRVMEAAAGTQKTKHANKEHNNNQHPPPVMKYPLSDKFKVYPGCDGLVTSAAETGLHVQPTWTKPDKKSDMTKICRPHPSRKDTWSLCPGEPTEDDWSYSHSKKVNHTQDRREEEEEQNEREGEGMAMDQDVVVGGSEQKQHSSRDFDYSFKENQNFFKTSAANTDIKRPKISVKPVDRTFASIVHQDDERYSRQVPFQEYAVSDQEYAIFKSQEQTLTDVNAGHDLATISTGTDQVDQGKYYLQTEGLHLPLKNYKSDVSSDFDQRAIKTNYVQPHVLPVLGHDYSTLNNCKQFHETQEQQENGLKGFHSVGTPLLEKSPITSNDHSVMIGETEQSVVRAVQTDSGNVVRKEAETNTEPISALPSHPKMLDSFTQTKVSSGFVGGYWDSSSNNNAKIPVPEPQQLTNLPDQTMIEKIPERSCVPANVPRGPQSRQTGFRNGTPGTEKQGLKTPVENWDENLVETLSTMNLESPYVSKRTESSIAVNTNHDSISIPRLPSVSAVGMKQTSDIAKQETSTDKHRMMTDDQKLSDQQLNTGNSDQTNSTVGNTGQSTLPCGLPEGLPPHLIQAYMEYISQSDPNTVQKEHQHQEAVSPNSQEPKGQVSSSLENPSTMRPFNQTGFMPPVWSPLFPWMMAGPMMPQPLVPFLPPLFAYSLQQQMENKEHDTGHFFQQPRQEMGTHQGDFSGVPQRTNSCTQDPDQCATNSVTGKDQNNSAHNWKGHSLQYSPDTPQQNHDTQLSNCTANQGGGQHAVPSFSHSNKQDDWKESLSTSADNELTGQGSDRSTVETTHNYQQPYSQRYIRTTLPPRFQRQKRLELKKKIRTLISEIKKDDEYIETEIGTEENRMSTWTT